MADSTTNLDLISASQASKEVTANALFDAASVATLFGRRASACVGLTWGFYGGKILVNGVITSIANGTVALTASSTNYVESTSAGVVSANTTGFTAGRVQLYTVVTGTSSVTSYTDQRTLNNAYTNFNSLSVDSNSTTPAVRITQTGSGNAFVVEDSASTDATPFVIDSAGNVGIGTDTTSTRKLNILQTQSDTANTEIANNVVATATNTSGAVTKIASFSNIQTGTGYAGTGTLFGSYAQATHAVTGTVGNLVANVGIVANTSTGTVSSATNYQASSATNSGGGTISQQIGFICNDLTAATANYGFYSNVNSGANKFGFYAAGTAENYFNGNVQLTKNLTFTGTGNRITGDFSNATVANRVLFQTSTTNSTTLLGVIPNGTGFQSNCILYNNSDPTNAGTLNLLVNALDSSVRAGITGTGTYLPMTFYTGGSERLRIDTSGNVGIGTVSPTNIANYKFVSTAATTGAIYQAFGGSSTDARVFADNAYGGTGMFSNHPFLFYTNSTEKLRIGTDGTVTVSTAAGLGYGTGAGGTVTQGATSGKATAVTLNKPCGQITMNNAILNAGTIVSFTLTNSNIAAADTILINHQSVGTLGAYLINGACAAGSATISVRNTTAGNLTEAIVLNFTVIKGATS